MADTGTEKELEKEEILKETKEDFTAEAETPKEEAGEEGAKQDAEEAAEAVAAVAAVAAAAAVILRLPIPPRWRSPARAAP